MKPSWCQILALTLCASIIPASSSGQSSPAALTVSLNASGFAIGDTMTLTARLASLQPPLAVDAYVVVQLPTGEFLSLQLSGALVPGLVPIARDFVPFAYEGSLVQYRFSGSEPHGTYSWYAALARPGTLTLVTPIHQASFTFSNSTPSTTRTQLANALSAGSLEAAARLTGTALVGELPHIGSTDRLDIAGALRTCTVVEATAKHQVCATPDQEFRFVMVRDDQGVWRVITW